MGSRGTCGVDSGSDLLGTSNPMMSPLYRGHVESPIVGCHDPAPNERVNTYGRWESDLAARTTCYPR